MEKRKRMIINAGLTEKPNAHFIEQCEDLYMRVIGAADAIILTGKDLSIDIMMLSIHRSKGY